MTSRRHCRLRLLASAAASVLVVLTVPAWGAPTPETANLAEDRRPVTVVLHGESVDVSAEGVRAAVEAELGVAAVAFDSGESLGARGTLTITYRPENRELAVTYHEAGRGSVTRVITAPERARDVPGAAALLAGNLVRNQTTDFLTAAEARPASVVTGTPPPSVTVPATASPLPPPAVERFANAAVFYPLSTNRDAPDLATNLDFNLIYGHIGRLQGFELGLVNEVSGDADGVQLGFAANLVGGRVRGLQLGSYNLSRSGLDAIQVGLLNRAAGAGRGGQFGALNLGGDDFDGAELGIVNVAHDVSGLQLGVVNVGGHIRGTQIGLVNVSDDMDGVPIGLISVSRTGGVHPLAWASNTTYANLGVKFATRYTYTVIAAAAHDDGRHALYGGGLTFGTSIPVAPHTFFEIDVGATHLFANTPCCQEWFLGAIARQHDQSLGKVRALIRGEFMRRLSLFAGAGVTGRVTYPLVGVDTEVRFALAPEFFGGVQL